MHLIISIDRFLQRLLATTAWGAWAIKGGYASQLRHPDEARFTEDVDLRIDADIAQATAMVSEAVLHDLDDRFTFELAALPRTLVGPPGGGLRYVLVARLVGQEFVRFKVDVSSQDIVIGKLEKHRSDPLVERLGLQPATFPVYPIAQQFAEKLHAYSRPRDVENTRAKDLADMVWITTRHPFRSQTIIDAGLATFGQREEHTWPPAPPLPPAAWARQVRGPTARDASRPGVGHRSIRGADGVPGSSPVGKPDAAMEPGDPIMDGDPSLSRRSATRREGLLVPDGSTWVHWRPRRDGRVTSPLRAQE